MPPKPKILIIHTGGTIGMMHSEKGYVPDPDFPKKLICDIDKIKSSNIPDVAITAINPLLDSSNMTPSDWNKIANVIKENQDKDYDGFLILHGTDTMAFTASALSFMIENQKKPVIITGSQIPYCEIRNDAWENLIASLMICAKITKGTIIPEVAVCFDNKLLRGCRTTKVDATHFGAFDSPNFPPLAEIGIGFDFSKQATADIKLNTEIKEYYSRNASHKNRQNVHLLGKPLGGGEYNVGLLRLFPGMSADFVKSILRPGLRGLVLESYGVGNGPTKERAPELYEAIRKAAQDDGIVICAVTQCLRGTVIMNNYETSLASAGVISGYDMTVEAALAKMYYLFYTGLGRSEVKRRMQVNMRGELTK